MGVRQKTIVSEKPGEKTKKKTKEAWKIPGRSIFATTHGEFKYSVRGMRNPRR
jgi:hypothetical protein